MNTGRGGRVLWSSTILALVAMSGGMSCRSDAPAAHRSAQSADFAQLTIILVESESGASLAGVRLELECVSTQEESYDHDIQAMLASERTACTTDTRGEVRFELRTPREYTVHGRLRESPFGYFSRNVGALAFGEHAQVRIELPVKSDRVVHGGVTSARGHSPIAGARVVVFNDQPLREEFDSPMVRRFGDGVETSANGEFTLRVSSAFPVQLSITAEHFAPAIALIRPALSQLLRQSSGFEFNGSQPAPELTLDVLLEPAEITLLHVVDSAGVPQPDVDVTAWSIESRAYLHTDPDQPASVESDPIFYGRTDAAGICRVLLRSPLGLLQIELSRDGCRLRREFSTPRLKSDALADLVFVVGSLSKIAGRVLTPEGAIVAGQELWLVDPRGRQADRYDNPDRPVASTITGADGSYGFENVCEGEWLVGPPYRRLDALCVDANAPAPIGRRVKVRSARATIATDLCIGPGRYVTGRAIDENGNGVSKLTVLLRDGDNLFPIASASWSDGSFLLGPLAAGEYTLEFDGNADWTPSQTIRAQAGARDLVLRVAKAATLRVRVEDVGGAVCSDVQIDLQRHADPGSAEAGFGPTRWNESRWEFQSLCAGRYDLLVRRHGKQNSVTIAAASVELATGESRDLTLRLEAAARMDLHNKSDAAVRIEYRANEGQLEFIGLPPGAWADRNLPGGSVELRILDADGKELMRRTESLTADQTTLVQYP